MPSARGTPGEEDGAPRTRRGDAPTAGPFDFSPLRIAAIYAVLGALWIQWSDQVVEAIVRDQASLTRLQTAKGWFFVVASAALIYVLVSRRVRKLHDAERKERDARATLEAAIDASPYAMFTLDESGRVASWNAAAQRLFGPSAQEIVGTRVVGRGMPVSLGSEAVHEALGTLFRQALTGVVGTAYSVRAPSGGMAPGQRQEIRLVVGPVEGEAKIQGAVVFARDVTDERASARERARLVAVLEATSDLVAVFTPDGRPRYINASGRRLLGIAPDAPLERYSADDFLTEGERLSAPEVRAVAVERGVLELERTIRNTDGTTIPVSQVIVVHRGADGEVEFLSTIARDLRERLKQEAALRQSQKMEAVGRLAGGVAHDFNNLLTVILGCAEVLRAMLTGDEGREEANEIVLAAGRAARLTRQLLAYSRQQVMAVDLVDVNAVVRDLLEMLRRLVGDDIVLEEALDPATPRIRVDRGQFEQVIVNLVVNARDAMPQGGTVTIRSRPVWHAGAAAAEVEVQDTGVGMDDETRGRVFEPFFTTKGPGSGTGLGLATVYGIVKQSGGEIGVESAPGVGATFRIVLPADATATGNTEAANVPTPSGGTPIARGGKRVLVVEDEPAVRRMAARILREDGWQVEEAGSPDEAMGVMRSRRDIALVLTDVEMPNGGGRALAVQLSELPVVPPLIFMSGYTTDALLLRGSLPSNASFIAKPFTSDTLRKAVRDALRGA